MKRILPLLVASATATAISGCGGGDNVGVRPEIGAQGDQQEAAQALGFPLFATKNTTRVGGSDATANAAGVALATYPGGIPSGHPRAVVLSDKNSWQASLAAAQLMSQPLAAPILLTDGDSLPDASSTALHALAPRGSSKLHAAQIIRIGDVATPDDYRSIQVKGDQPANLARAIDRFYTRATGNRSNNLLLVSATEAAYAMSAAGWAAKSGDPILFTQRNKLPGATRAEILKRDRPRVFVLGPTSVISSKVKDRIARLGAQVTRIQGPDPVRNAIAFARFQDGNFGWGITDPGHGLIFANADDPLNATAAAPLSASGTYGPLLLLQKVAHLPKPLRDYLLDIQPGYESDPVRGVYNHGWLIGDTDKISAGAQSQIDSLLEIVPVNGTLG